jgi:hypothetical protein
VTIDAALVVAVLNIVIGILIIVFPAMLRVLVGGYFIVSGVLTLVFLLGGP